MCKSATRICRQECQVRYTKECYYQDRVMPPLARTSRETDREALTALYNATDGPNWLRNENWLSDAPMSEWSGVTTGSNGRVARLALQLNELSGELPPELGSLANLTELHLDGNDLTGNIPPELGNLANLTEMHLDGNYLNGKILPELGNLINLRLSWLYENHLSGEIPPEFGKLTNLTDLKLGDNQLSGCVPSILRYCLDMSLSDLGGLPFC